MKISKLVNYKLINVKTEGKYILGKYRSDNKTYKFKVLKSKYNAAMRARNEQIKLKNEITRAKNEEIRLKNDITKMNNDIIKIKKQMKEDEKKWHIDEKNYENVIENFKKDRIYYILRKNRVINEKLGCIIQKPVIHIDKNTFYYTVANNENIVYFKNNYLKIINEFHKIIYSENSNIINASIQLSYVSPLLKDNIDEETCNVKYTQLEPFNKNTDISKSKFNIESTSSSFTYIIIGYRIVYETNRNSNLSDKSIYDLKAFHPANDRKYHELTTSSTSQSKMCIYETF